MGGDSLLATQIVGRVREALQVELPLGSLFENSNVAGLAEQLGRMEATQGQTKKVARVLTSVDAMSCEQVKISTLKLKRRSEADSVPLSFTQEQMWFLDQLVPGNPLYNVPTVVGLNGPLDVMALEKSINEIVRRHESLRTTFAAVEGIPVQRIASALTLTLAMTDLMKTPESARADQVTELVTQESRRPFDLSKGPLLRVTLLRVGVKEYVLVIVVHHIIIDGWSMEVFMRELGTLYESFTAGKPSPLCELSIQHADFVAWQRQYLQGGVLEDQLSYWKKQLAGAPAVLKLPTDHPRSQVQAFEGARRSVLLPQNLYEGLKDLSSQERVTLFMTLLAAFKSLLFCRTGQQDIVVGTPIAGRDRLEIEGVIGLFINTLVLRTDFSLNPTFREVLGRVRNVALGAYSHQEMPFAKLVEQLQPKRQLGTYPLFNVWFVFRDRTPTLKLSDMTVSEVQLDVETARYDLKLEISKRQDGLSASFVYDKGLFNASTIVQIADHFAMLVRAVVNRPDLRLRDLTDILAEADRQQQVTRGKEFGEVSRQKLQQARRKATAAPQFKARD